MRDLKKLVLAVIIPTVIVASALFGFLLWTSYNHITLMRVGTASMTPTFEDNDLILVQPRAFGAIKAGLKPEGDIIVFRNPQVEEELVVRRVVGKALYYGLWFFETEGDANDVADVWTGIDTWSAMVSEKLVVGVVVGRISQTVLVLFIVAAAIIILLPPVVVYVRAKRSTVRRNQPLSPAPSPET